MEDLKQVIERIEIFNYISNNYHMLTKDELRDVIKKYNYEVQNTLNLFDKIQYEEDLDIETCNLYDEIETFYKLGLISIDIKKAWDNKIGCVHLKQQKVIDEMGD